MNLYLTQLALFGLFLAAIGLTWRRWREEFDRCYGDQAQQQRRLRATAIRLHLVTNVSFAAVIPGSIVLSFALARVVENVLPIFFIILGTLLLLSFGVPAVIAKRNSPKVYNEYVEELGRISLTGFRYPLLKVGFISTVFIVLGALMLVGVIK